MGPQTQNTNWKWNVIKARGKRKLVQLCIFNDNVCYKDQTLLFEGKIEKKREKWKIDFYDAHFSMLETILTTGNARASSSCASPPLGKRLCCAPHFFFFRWTRAMRMWRKIPSTTADARRDYQNEFGAWKAHWWLIRPVFRSDLSEFYWKMYSKVLMLITAVALYPVLMYVSQSSKLAITDTRKLFFFTPNKRKFQRNVIASFVLFRFI